MSGEITGNKTLGGDRLYRFAQIVLKPGLKLAFGVTNFRRENVPVEGPVLLVANHQSYLDPVLAGVFLPRACDFMARDTLFTNRFFGWMIRELNAFPVRRGHADVSSIKECLRRLKNGRMVMLFPEGTRTVDGRIAPMQPGAVALARRAKAPMVPCAIEGAFEIWPRTRKLPRPAKVWLDYGPPLTLAQIEGQSDDEVAAELTRRLRELHNGLRQRAGRRPFDYTDTGPAEPRPESPGITHQGAHHG